MFSPGPAYMYYYDEEDLQQIELPCRHWVCRSQLDKWLLDGVDSCPVSSDCVLKKGTVLIAAILKNDTPAIEEWFDTHPANFDELVEMCDLDGNSIIMMAVQGAHESTVEVLLEQLVKYFGKGSIAPLLVMANNAADKPLMAAAEKNDLVKAEYLMRAGLAASTELARALAIVCEEYGADHAITQSWQAMIAKYRLS